MRIKYIITLVALAGLVFQSCDKSEQVVSGKEGGLVEIKNPSINYVVGNPGPYSSAIRVYQGEIKTTKVDIYKTFYGTVYDTITVDSIVPKSVVSNTVLYTTIELSSVLDQNSIQSFEFTFDDLREGLTVEGNELPANDGNYQIGDYWEFTYFSTVSDGRVVQQNTTTKATVATRYAGKYKCIDGRYFRLGVLTYTTGDWPAETYIESVDAKTYKVLEYWGAFDGNEWYFQIENGVITYPAEWDGVAQLLNGQPLITCESSPGDMTEVCGLPGANTVVNDDVNGKDLLIMANGYYTSGSGPRVGYQVMEKIVE